MTYNQNPKNDEVVKLVKELEYAAKYGSHEVVDKLIVELTKAIGCNKNTIEFTDNGVRYIVGIEPVGHGFIALLKANMAKQIGLADYYYGGFHGSVVVTKQARPRPDVKYLHVWCVPNVNQ